MKAPASRLFLLIIVLVLNSACSSTQFAKQPETLRGAREAQQQSAVTADAIVKAPKANLRDRPSKSASVVSTLNRGDRLLLNTERQIGPWYHVRDDKRGSEGWIHGNAIALLQLTTSSSAAQTRALDKQQRPALDEQRRLVLMLPRKLPEGAQYKLARSALRLHRNLSDPAQCHHPFPANLT